MVVLYGPQRTRYLSHVEIALLNVTQAKELNANQCLITAPSIESVAPDSS